MPPLSGRPDTSGVDRVAEIPGGRRGARRPNLYDVAREAGVSHQTVSRVVNGHPGVLPATRTRVQAAVAVIGYRPNSAARALVTRRSGVLGIVIPRSTVFGRPTTVSAVEEAAREAGWFASIRSLSADDLARGPVDTEQLTEGVDGVVVVASWDPLAEVGADLAGFVPTVMVARPGRTIPPGVAGVSVDQQAGARAAVGHLADLGHRRILHIGGPPAFADARAREAGYHQEMSSRGLPSMPVVPGDWTPETGHLLGTRMDRDDLPDAVFLANDMMALGFLRAMRERGIDVPGDISVVGFDDVTGSGYFDPPLTTVRQDLTALGRRAVAVLGAQLDDRDAALPVAAAPSGPTVRREGAWPPGVTGPAAVSVLRPELIVRSSTAGPGRTPQH